MSEFTYRLALLRGPVKKPCTKNDRSAKINIKNLSEFWHHSLFFEEGALHFIAKGRFNVTPVFLLQFLEKIDFQSSHHLLPELLRGAGETAFRGQGDKHMGWEGHL